MSGLFWLCAVGILFIALSAGLHPLSHEKKVYVSYVAVAGILVIAMYLFLGSPGRVTEETRPRTVVADDLRDYLARNAKDEDAWLYLARLSMELDRFSQAAAAYEALIGLRGEQTELLLQWADALAMAKGGDLSGKPERLVRRALAVTPDSRNGLWMAGMAAMERGDREEALSYWRQLLPQLAKQPEARDLLKKMMAEAGVSPHDGKSVYPEAVPGAVVAFVQAPRSHLAGVPDDTPVFVIVREDGDTMPLAVVRRSVGDLPFTVVLDEKTVLMPGVDMKSRSILRVHARIAIRGDAIPAPGDPISVRHIVSPGEVVGLDLARKVGP